MNQFTDPQELKLDGQPVFELDHTEPWPKPVAQPVAPQTMMEIVRNWIARELSL
jgi:hypothetical protein